MRQSDATPGDDGGQGHRSILPARHRRTGIAFALQLFRQDPTFRGLLEFAVIGGLVLAFLHPPALPDLGALFASAGRSVGSSAKEPPQLDKLIKASRENAPTAPSPKEVDIDRMLFGTSSHEEQRRLNRAVAAYEVGQPAQALTELNHSALDDPNVLLVRGLAMLALPGFENLQAGIGFLDRAIELGQRQAKVYRGLLYVYGPASVERDPERGLALMREAADDGDPVAARLVGTSYHRGWGGIVDQGLAVHYTRLATEGGDPEAYTALAYFVWSGLGVAKDEAEATRLLTRAAELGDQEGQQILGAFYLMQFAGGWMPNPAEAIRWLTRAADQGNVYAMELLGLIYSEIGKTPPWLDPPRGTAVYQRCADHWYGPCMFQYARALERGIGTTRDVTRAYVYYSLALQLGVLDATKPLEDMEPTLTKAQRDDAVKLARTMVLRRMAGEVTAEQPATEQEGAR